MPVQVYNPNQNFTITVPLDSEIFRVAGEVAAGTQRVYKRVGNDIVSIPEDEWKKLGISYGGLPEYNGADIRSTGWVTFNKRDVKDVLGTDWRTKFVPSGPTTYATHTVAADPQLQARIGSANRAGVPLAQYTGPEGLNPKGQTLSPFSPEALSSARESLSAPGTIQATPQRLTAAVGAPQDATGASGGQSGASLGLSEPLASLYDQLNGYLSELQKRGQVLNPNIDITPEKIAEFTKVAESEINPFYEGQLKLARESLLKSIGYSRDEILRNELDLERKYQANVRQLGEQSAETGFAQSGRRSLSEQELAAAIGRDIESGRRQLGFNVGQSLGGFARQYGTAQTTIPSINEAPTVTPGESVFGRTSRELPLYQLSPSIFDGLVGEQEFARRGAISKRISEQEQAQRTLQALQQQRQLNM